MQSNCVWDDIFFGRNKKEKHYLEAITWKLFIWVPIIQWQFSGWQLFEGNYQWSIILRGNTLGVNCWGATYLVDEKQFSEGQLSCRAVILGVGGNCPGANYLGPIVLGGAVFRGQLPCSCFQSLLLNFVLYIPNIFEHASRALHNW